MVRVILELAHGVRTLLKASVLVIGARVLGGVVGLASHVFVARILGPEALGQFFFALSLAMVLSILCSMGYPWIAARYVARHETGRTASNFHEFLAHVHRDIALSSAVLVGLAGIVIFLITSWPLETRLGLFIGIATAPFFALMKLNGALANAQKKFMLAYLPDLLLRPLFLMGFILLLYGVTTGLTVNSMLAGHFVIVIALMAYQASRLRGLTKSVKLTSLQSENRSGDATKHESPRQWRKHALPMIVATLFVSVFADLDIVLVGTLLAERELAIFGASLKFALFLAFAIQAIHQLILRDAAEALEGGDRNRLGEIIGRANLLGIALSLGALGFVVFWGQDVLRIFGSDFTEGHVCLIILVAAQLARSAAGPAVQILALSGHERHGLPVFAAGLGLLVISNLILVPPFGATGAALAVFIVTLMWTIGLAVTASRRAGVNTTVLPNKGFFQINDSDTNAIAILDKRGS